jgi:hypothetical protein
MQERLLWWDQLDPLWYQLLHHYRFLTDIM